MPENKEFRRVLIPSRLGQDGFHVFALRAPPSSGAAGTTTVNRVNRDS